MAAAVDDGVSNSDLAACYLATTATLGVVLAKLLYKLATTAGAGRYVGGGLGRLGDETW